MLLAHKLATPGFNNYLQYLTLCLQQSHNGTRLPATSTSLQAMTKSDKRSSLSSRGIYQGNSLIQTVSLSDEITVKHSGIC